MFFFGFPFFFLVPFVVFFVLARVGRESVRRMRDRRDWDELSYSNYRSEQSDSIPTSRKRREVAIFKLAYKLQGRLTISDVVVETSLSVAEAEALMKDMVDGTHVRMEIDDRGMIVYEFPEIMDRFGR